ncbi:MAG: hypothetical protein RIQ41_381 [Candidatus Parcubacteria bacterium]|jgi:tRNA G18 (ribose-2'-O)-methylase SpoU
MHVVVLDNIRSVYNVGSIFRTANACGIGKVLLCGITPGPLDIKGRKRTDFAKVSLGAEDKVLWERKASIREALESLHKEGYHIIAIEQDSSSMDYKRVTSKPKTAFVLGSEVDGVEKEVLSMCDVVAEIPMLGTKESLNVTIAFGVAAYRILGV